ncbi:hypothetical protein EZS27_017304 [termite gut metagenome]|uniref:Uncharacterized protein n=1 Tax=termite gut metagenome TaxID=433724 RepID=A0A5J4RMN1_9ZZZZ
MMKIYNKDGINDRPNFLKSEEIAREMANYLSTDIIREELEELNKPGGTSQEIQGIINPKAEELGFRSEKKGLFKEFQLRPDYFLELGENKGIIMEVERGKTLANNMDLLDVWKCHICPCANFLFLIVPMIRPTKKGGRTKAFDSVEKRISPFFEKENYINVDAVFLFGY